MLEKFKARMSIRKYLKRRYRDFVLYLKQFKKTATRKLLERPDIELGKYDAIRNFGEISQENPNNTLSELLSKFKSKIFKHRQYDLTNAAKKTNLTRKERVLLFLASKLTTEKQFQRETRVYRDKKTKEVTVIDSVKEVK